jgi:hypothetical protein
MPDGRMTEARRRLVERHEDVHVWQARLLGPIYALGYVGWSGVGALAGALSWLFDRRRSPFVRRIDAFAYYRNPFEWHAYSRDGNWPPRGVDSSLVWRRRFDEAFRGCGGNRAERS